MMTPLGRMDAQILSLAARPTAYIPFSQFDHDLEPIWRWLPFGNSLLRYRMKWLLRRRLLSIDHTSKQYGVRTRSFHTTAKGLDHLAKALHSRHSVGTLARHRH
jgi:hypothetical protein